jgi:translation factor GUF1, mitochondrial
MQRLLASKAWRHFSHLLAPTCSSYRSPSVLHPRLPNFLDTCSWRQFSLRCDLQTVPPERIRNFAIIAHIDHGKSTLADRLLEYTGAVSSVEHAQVLDSLQVERERGITVKAQTVSLFHKYKGEDYLLNLIDTPGHVDFSYEVSRSLSACDGCILLVDATQGIQAQTLANFYLALGQDLVIIPCLNKIDMPTSDVDGVTESLVSILDFDPDEVRQVSAKSGQGVGELLDILVEKLPPPRLLSAKNQELLASLAPEKDPLRSHRGHSAALLFDCWYDTYRGVVCVIKVLSGSISAHSTIVSHHTGRRYEVSEVGLLHPKFLAVPTLHVGQVGIFFSQLKSMSDAMVGDTLRSLDWQPDPHPGFAPPRHMVYAGIFPLSSEDFPKLEAALHRLSLHDASIYSRKETSSALGMGYRCGFLGMLHMDVFVQRLRDEFELDVLTTAPTVPLRIEYPNQEKEDVEISHPADFPPSSQQFVVYEPVVKLSIITPTESVGAVLEEINSRRASESSISYLTAARALIACRLPLSELISNFYDRLKGMTAGYASCDYEEDGHQAANIVKLTISLNDEPVDALSPLVHASKAMSVGRVLTKRLKEVIPRHQFEVAVRASINSRVLCRETIKPYRKDVTAKLYGGDVTRKQKLLKKQKEGKKRMKVMGGIQLPSSAFAQVLKQ